MDSNQMPFVLLFLILGITLIFVFIQNNESPADIKVPDEITCKNNQTRSCTKYTCNGTQTCINGKWSSCNWEIICDPGDRAPCSISMCGNSYKECNDCGNGYEKFCKNFSELETEGLQCDENCISGQEG